MKNLKILFTAILILLTSCSDYDDSDIRKGLDDLNNRVAALEETCKRLNTELAALQTIITAYGDKEQILSVVPLMEGTEEIGCRITFEKFGSIDIFYGKNSTPVPVIGIKQDTDGNWYWTQTINGVTSWITDAEKNKVQTTPQFRISADGNWEMSADGGKNWHTMGQATGATGEQGDSLFQNVEVDEENKTVTFTLADGMELTLPLDRSFDITFEQAGGLGIVNSDITEIEYTITGADANTEIEIIAPQGWIVKVEPSGYSSGKLVIIPPTVIENDKILVFVSDGKNRVLMRSISLVKGEIIVLDKEYTINSEGGTINIRVSHNTDYSLHIPTTAGSWIAPAPETRSMETSTTSLVIAPNPDRTNRYAVLEIKDIHNNVRSNILIQQEGIAGELIIHIEQPGTLSSMISTANAEKVNQLVLSGTPGFFDFDFIKMYMRNLEYVDMSRLESTVWLPNGLFESYKYLKTVLVPSQTSMIPNDFFKESSIESIHIPKQITIIQDNAFLHCSNLKEITFESNSKLGVISSNSFSGCYNLEKIIIPASVLHIDAASFFNCTKLSTVEFEENSQLIRIGMNAFNSCGIEEITISDTAIRVETSAFYNSKLKKVYIGKNVSSIEAYAFMECNQLEIVEIPEDSELTEIGDLAFYGTYHLKSIRFPSQLKNLGKYPLLGSGIQEIVMDTQFLQYIPDYTFSWCTQLTSISIPASVKSIGEHAFNECHKLKTILFQENSQLEIIDDRSFFNCKELKKIIIPASVEIIGRNAFTSCRNLEDIIFEENNRLQILDSECFSQTGIINFTYPAAREIRSGVLDGCNSLVSVTYPSDTKFDFFSYETYSDFTNLQFVIILKPSFIGCWDKTFYNIHPEAVLRVPSDLKEQYSNDIHYSQFFKTIEGI